MSSPPLSSSTSIHAPPAPEAPKESLFTHVLLGPFNKFIVGPLNFVSFLLSLWLVNTRNHALRMKLHPNDRPNISWSEKLFVYIHNIAYKPRGDPYAYVRAPAAEPSNAPIDNGNHRPSNLRAGVSENTNWHWHSQQRHLLKAELSDAFKVRLSIKLMLLIAGVLAILIFQSIFTYGIAILTRWHSSPGSTGFKEAIATTKHEGHWIQAIASVTTVSLLDCAVYSFQEWDGMTAGSRRAYGLLGAAIGVGLAYVALGVVNEWRDSSATAAEMLRQLSHYLDMRSVVFDLAFFWTIRSLWEGRFVGFKKAVQRYGRNYNEDLEGGTWWAFLVADRVLYSALEKALVWAWAGELGRLAQAFARK